MSDAPPTIAIVGATGAVGQEALTILAQRGVPPDRIWPYASSRSVGTGVRYLGTTIKVRASDSIAADASEFTLLCAGTATARTMRDALAGTQTVIIDNSSAFRMDPDVPLVIPEVNGHLLNATPKVIANPNCSTIMLLTALSPLHESIGIKGVIVTTYQAVSGAGAAGLAELRSQTRAALAGIDRAPGVFPVSCAFNVFEHESAIDPQTGFNGEESKMIVESRKILGTPALPVLATCVRVPVERAHSQSVIVELGRPAGVDEIRAILAAVPGVRLHEGPSPLNPRAVAGGDEVVVGRIRIDPDDPCRAVLWICCDQLRKGAALNAIQIMDRVIANRRRGSLVVQ